MDGIYLTPLSKFIELALAISGVVILYFASKIFASNHAWGDGAEYEMLGIEPEETGGPMGDGASKQASSPISSGAPISAGPSSGTPTSAAPSSGAPSSGAASMDEAAARGVIGPEDRIVRSGFTIALTYLAITWFGINSPAMWGLILPVLYLAGTAVVGRDPIYRRLRLTTKFQ